VGRSCRTGLNLRILDFVRSSILHLRQAKTINHVRGNSQSVTLVLAKLYAERRALTPVSREENSAEVVMEQAFYIPRPKRGRPIIGKVRGVEGVWVGGG